MISQLQNYLVVAVVSLLIGVGGGYWLKTRLLPHPPIHTAISAVDTKTDTDKEEVVVVKKKTTTKTTKPDSTVVEVITEDTTEKSSVDKSKSTTAVSVQVKPKYTVGYLLLLPAEDPLEKSKYVHSIFVGRRIGETNAHVLLGAVPQRKELSLGISIDF